MSSRKRADDVKEIGKGGIEEYLREEVRRRGGKCIKQNPAWEAGIFDRLVLLPRLMCLVETKRPKGGRLRETQKNFRDHLQWLELPVYVLSTKEEIDEFLKPFPVTSKVKLRRAWLDRN